MGRRPISVNHSFFGSFVTFNTVRFESIFFSRVHAKGFNGFKFGTFIGRFSSDGSASVAEKGLTIASVAFGRAVN